MIIKNIKLINFMPYKGEQKIDFPNKEKQNVMLLFGDNMRGKTSFLNSIRWAFYGHALGRHSRKIEKVNLVNREIAARGEWSTSVEIFFSHGKKEYRLTRRISKRSNVIVPSSDADFSEDIWLKVNGNPLENDRIENTINSIMPQDVSRFFLFDGELLQEYEDLLQDEKDQGKKIKSHIESVLGVPALLHGKTNIQLLLQDARKEQRREAKNSKDLESLATDQEKLEIELASLEEDLTSLKEKQSRHQSSVDEIDDFLSGTEAVQKKKTQLEGLERQLQTLTLDIERSDESIHNLLKNAWKDILAKHAQRKVSKLSVKRDGISKKVQDKNQLDVRIDDLKKLIETGKTCITCGQDVPKERLQPLRNKLDKFIADQTNMGSIDTKELDHLTRVIRQLNSITSEGEIERIIEKSNEKIKARLSLINVETEKDEIEEEIKGEDTEQISRKRHDRDQKLQRIGKLKSDIEGQEQKKQENLQEQVRLSEMMTKLGGGGANLVVNAKLTKMKALETLFEKGVNELRDKLKEDVERHATKTFKKLTTEKSYSSLQINSSYGLSILDENEKVLRERSAGAEQVVALALIDGLNKTSGTEAPIIMDTPFGRLDPKHRANIIKYIPSMSKQVVLLVHEGEIDPHRDIKVISDHIGSRYEIKRISATHSEIRRM